MKGCGFIGEYSIETENLTKRFVLNRGLLDLIRNPGRREVITTLDGVNLKVREGEVLGLLGPNGAGKSTLIKILCTLILPSEGNAYVGGFDVVKEGGKARSCIGFITTDERSFYWRLSGRENLQFFATLHNLPRSIARDRVEELLDVVRLKNRAHEPFLNYSAGMKQRMAIARGLLNDPAVLFMDEPTRSLDPGAAKSLRDFIKEHIVMQRGKTVFISTHQMDEAEELCNKVAILDEGKIKAHASPDELKGRLSADSSLRDVFSFYTGKDSAQEDSNTMPFFMSRNGKRGHGLGMGMKRKGF
ncbi:MAG TPA: ABC transporter ATP-binding protein [Methanothrix sp.]|nr:ABC transporter ATP-binding protein [Methanothrix sp.]